MEIAKDLMKYIDSSKTMFHAVEEARKVLEKNGYKKLKLEDKWDLKGHDKYYLIHNDSSIFAFELGKDLSEGFKIVGSHTDSPSFKIKPNSTIKSDGYITLNTEVYGGPILESWFDRPLSIAGRVYSKGQSYDKPKMNLIDIDRDLLIIPNLAIHMSRSKDEEKNINPQKHTLPIISLEKDDFSIESLIAEDLGIPEDQILSYDLYLYAREKSTILGLDREFISAPKLDNLGMVHASLQAMVDSKKAEQTKIFAAFDNEEIGSSSVAGANSGLLLNIIKKINSSLGFGEEDLISKIYKSFMVSADQAHSVHPNYADKADPSNRPVINRGPVIKESARKSYASDGYGKAVLISIFEDENIPYQEFVNRSDMRGGSTIGPISEVQTSIRNIDIGNALLSMHSVRELGGVDDQKYMKEFLEKFLEK